MLPSSYQITRVFSFFFQWDCQAYLILQQRFLIRPNVQHEVLYCLEYHRQIEADY